MKRLLAPALFGLLTLAPEAAIAAEKSAEKGGDELIFIGQIVLLLVVGRALGEIMQRLKQPAIIGQLLAGILLGPTIFGALLPQLHDTLFPQTIPQKGMVDAVGQLGVLMILLLTGMDTDLQLVKRVGRSAIIVSIAGVALPFMCGFTLGQFLPDSLLPDQTNRLVASLFLGTALSISSVKIVALVVRELNFMRRDIGQIIVASAVIEDTIGWVIIAVTFGLASQSSFDFVSLARSIIGTALFLIFSLTIGRRLTFWLIRWANDMLVSEFAVITVVVVLMGSMAIVTHLIGVHSVLGAFVAGVLIGESPILVRHIDEQLRGIITALFMPVFFGLAGLGADLSILADTRMLLLTLTLVLIASIGKFGGAFVGGKLGGLSTREALALGCAMNARGSTEVIVATIGLSIGVLSQSLFTMILTMAVVTTMAMPPMLRLALLRLPMRKSERIRLEREESDKTSLVARLERLLLAVDESNHGKLASHFAGYIAGFRGMPVTVLHRNSAQHSDDGQAKGPAQAVEESVIGAAQDSAANTRRDEHEANPKDVDVTLRKDSRSAPKAVAHEASKGYGLLWIGLDNPVSARGHFSAELNGIASEFNSAIALVIARDDRPQTGPQKKSKILIPVSGTQSARFAAELAIIIARSNRADVTALYVTAGTSKGGKQSRGEKTRALELKKNVLADITQLGKRHGVKIGTIVNSSNSPRDAILRELKKGDYDTIMIGVERRQGDALFFGPSAETIATHAKQTVILVSSPRYGATTPTADAG